MKNKIGPECLPLFGPKAKRPGEVVPLTMGKVWINEFGSVIDIRGVGIIIVSSF